MTDDPSSRRGQGKGRRFARAFAALALAALASTPVSAHAMRVAFGDIPSIEGLNLMIALERARERGLDVNLTFFESEAVAAQAVLGGGADIGAGAPYALIQTASEPLRLIFQMSTLDFVPVVNTKHYQRWKDLDRQEITVHSRGSGTEAIAKLMAQRHGIAFSRIAYVPGSEVRAGAMLQGDVHAAIVDAASWSQLQEQGGERFKRLSIGDLNATDEALYARSAYLEEHPDKVRILLEEMLRTWREIHDDPAIVAKLRDRYNLLPGIPEDADADIVSFYRNGVAQGAFPRDGGQLIRIRDDLALYTSGGQLRGDPQALAVEDFWNLEPLRKARSRLDG